MLIGGNIGGSGEENLDRGYIMYIRVDCDMYG